MIHLDHNLAIVDLGVRTLYWDNKSWPLQQIKILHMANTPHEQEVLRIGRLGDDKPEISINGRYATTDIPALRAALDEAERIAREWAAEAEGGAL